MQTMYINLLLRSIHSIIPLYHTVVLIDQSHFMLLKQMGSQSVHAIVLRIYMYSNEYRFDRCVTLMKLAQLPQPACAVMHTF